MKTKLCLDQLGERKGQLLPLTDFSKSKRNKTGCHSYCRKCSVRRATETRRKNKPRLDVVKARRERERERERRKRAEEAEREQLSTVERVYHEIDRGNGAEREEIEAATGLDEDAIADALADLWDRNQVRIVGRRFYPRVAA